MTPRAPEGRDRPHHGTGGASGGSPPRGGPLPVEPPYASPDVAPILDQEFDGGSLYALRSAVDAHAVAAGMPHGRSEDVVICVHELATNAIRHGRGSGRVRVWRLAGLLRCQVDDGEPAGPGGRATPFADHGGPPGDAGNAATRWPFQDGHGLWLVRYAGDGLGLWSGPRGTRAAVTFTVPGPGPRPPFRLARRTLGVLGGRPRVLLTATGDLDREAGGELLAAGGDLLADGPLDLVLDLRDVALADVAGVAALVGLQHEVDRMPSATLTVVLGAVLRRRLRRAGLTERLTVVGDIADAVGGVVGPAGEDGRAGRDGDRHPPRSDA